MFNFTKAEINAVIFVVVILMISGFYYLFTPHKSLQPPFDYSASDSSFKRLSQQQQNIQTDASKSVLSSNLNKNDKTVSLKTIEKPSNKKIKPIPASININTSPEKELQKLPRIGPTMAKRIIDYRNTYGNFKKPEDLLNVKGIGKKTLEKLRPYIVLK